MVASSFTGVWRVRSDVEDLVVGIGALNGFGDDGRDVINVAECPGLEAVTEDGELLALHDLVHENADHIAIRVADVLAFSVDIVGPENHVVEPEHFVRALQIQFDSQFGDAIWVFR